MVKVSYGHCCMQCRANKEDKVDSGDGRNGSGPFCKVKCRHFEAYTREWTRLGFWFGANAKAEVRFHVTCQRCKSSRYYDHDYWGWPQGDCMEHTFSCCGNSFKMVSGEHGHWAKRFGKVLIIAGAVAAGGAVGAAAVSAAGVTVLSAQSATLLAAGITAGEGGVEITTAGPVKYTDDAWLRGSARGKVTVRSKMLSTALIPHSNHHFIAINYLYHGKWVVFQWGNNEGGNRVRSSCTGYAAARIRGNHCKDLGWFSVDEVRKAVEAASGGSYSVVSNNCNQWCERVAKQLTGRSDWHFEAHGCGC